LKCLLIFLFWKKKINKQNLDFVGLRHIKSLNIIHLQLDVRFILSFLCKTYAWILYLCMRHIMMAIISLSLLSIIKASIIIRGRPTRLGKKYQIKK
jgi:hypothetical protein